MSNHVTSLFRTLGCLLFSFGVKAEALKMTWIQGSAQYSPIPLWCHLFQSPPHSGHPSHTDFLSLTWGYQAQSPTDYFRITLGVTSFRMLVHPPTKAGGVLFCTSNTCSWHGEFLHLFVQLRLLCCLSHKSDGKLLQGGDHTLLFGLFL